MPIQLPPPPSLGHQPGLDGLRGVAIAAVIIFHLGWGVLPGGFFGVDVFFVLSGFLITTLLLEEHFQSGRISLSAFFFRRVLRLYPALVCLVVVSSVFTLLFQRETSLERTASIAASVLLYYANWLSMVDTKGWFGGMPHTWSLAVEAHFYVLWALLIATVTRRFGATCDRASLLKILLGIALAIVTASALWRAVLAAQGAEWLRTYLGTDTRLDSVFIGAAAALVRLQGWLGADPAIRASPGQGRVLLLQSVCAALVVYLFLTVKFGTALPGHIGFPVVSLATAVLLLSILQRPDTLWAAVLRWQPLTWLGRISYSLYIWHVPAGKLLKSNRLLAAGVPAWATEGLRLLATIVIAALSYYLIERTFLRWKKPRRRCDVGHLQAHHASRDAAVSP